MTNANTTNENNEVLSGQVILEMGYTVPINSPLIDSIVEKEGYTAQVMEDKDGNYHLFHRNGNDYFTYVKPIIAD